MEQPSSLLKPQSLTGTHPSGCCDIGPFLSNHISTLSSSLHLHLLGEVSPNNPKDRVQMTFCTSRQVGNWAGCKPREGLEDMVPSLILRPIHLFIRSLCHMLSNKPVWNKLIKGSHRTVGTLIHRKKCGEKSGMVHTCKSQHQGAGGHCVGIPPGLHSSRNNTLSQKQTNRSAKKAGTSGKCVGVGEQP